MSKLKFQVILITSLIWLLIFPGKIFASSMIVTIYPNKTLDPGQSFDLTITAKVNDRNSCNGCSVNINFDDKQPMDSITPSQGTTNSDGIFFSKIISFIPGTRQIKIQLKSPQGGIIATQSVTLSYSDNKTASVLAMMKKLLTLKISPPPLGNVYPKAIKQVYEGNSLRTIFLTYNKPVGTKFYQIKAVNKGENSNQLPIKVNDSPRTPLRFARGIIFQYDL